MNEASKWCRVCSFAVCSAFRGVLVEYETEIGPHVLQIGFRATATQTIDHLVELAEEGMKKFVRQEWDKKTEETVREVVRILLRCQISGTRPFVVPSGTRLRVSDSAVVIDLSNSCSPKRTKSSGGKRVDDSIDMASSWRIKATVDDDDQDDRDLDRNWMDALFPTEGMSRSQELSNSLYSPKHLAHPHEETSREDPMDDGVTVLVRRYKRHIIND